MFLLVLGEKRANEAMHHVSASYHREPMQANFDTVLQTTRLLFPLLESQDEELYAKLQDAGV